MGPDSIQHTQLTWQRAPFFYTDMDGSLASESPPPCNAIPGRFGPRTYPAHAESNESMQAQSPAQKDMTYCTATLQGLALTAPRTFLFLGLDFSGVASSSPPFASTAGFSG